MGLSYDEYKKMKDEGRIRWDTDAINKARTDIGQFLSGVDSQMKALGTQWTPEEFSGNQSRIAEFKDSLQYMQGYMNSIKNSNPESYEQLRAQYGELSKLLSGAENWFSKNSDEEKRNYWYETAQNQRKQAADAVNTVQAVSDMKLGKTTAAQAAAEYGLDEKQLQNSYDEVRAYEKQNDRENKYGKMNHQELLQSLNQSAAMQIIRDTQQTLKETKLDENQSQAQREEVVFQNIADKYGRSADEVRKIFEESKEVQGFSKYASNDISEKDKQYVFQRIIETGSSNELKELQNNLPKGDYYKGLREQLNQAIEEKKEEEYYLGVLSEKPDIEGKITSFQSDAFKRNGLSGNKLLQEYLKEQYGEDFEADKFIKYRQRYKEHQQNLQDNQALRDFTGANWLTAALMSVDSTPVNMVGSILDLPKIAAARVEQLFGGDGYYDPAGTWNYKANIMRDEAGKVIAGDNRIAQFLYSTGTSMQDMVLAAAVNQIPVAGQFISGAMFFSSAGVNAANEVIENGGDLGQATKTMIAQGAAELIFENVSLEKLKVMQAKGNVKGIKDLFANVLKQSFTEGSEEVATTLANTLTDGVINGDNSSINRAINQYMQNGYSREEAEKQAWKDWGRGLFDDFLGGALSGGVLGGGVSTVNLVKGKSRLKLGGVEITKAEAADLIGESNSEAAKTAQRIVKDNGVDAVLDAAKKSVDAQTRKTAEHFAKLHKEGKLDEKDAAQLFVKVANEQVTVDAIAQMTGAETLSDYQERQSQSGGEFAAFDYAGNKLETGQREMKSSFGEAHKNGLTATDRNGKAVVVLGIESSAAEYGRNDNTVSVKLSDGSIVDAAGIALSDEAYAQLLNLAPSYDTLGARALLANYESARASGMSLDDYKGAFNALYEMGGRGVSFESAAKNPQMLSVIRGMGETAARGAIEAGLNDRDISVRTQRYLLKKVRAPKVKSTAESRVYAERGVLTDDKSEMMNLLQVVAEKTGKEIVLTDVLGDDENGQFANGRIYVNAKKPDHVIFTTALHEATHNARVYDPEGFRALEKFVVNYLTEQGKDIDKMLTDISAIWGKDAPTSEVQMEELVCKTVESLAMDENALQIALETKKNQSILKKVSDALKRIADRVMQFFKGDREMAAHNAQAQAFLDDHQALERMAALCSTMFDEARENERKFGGRESGARYNKIDNPMQKEFEKHVDEIEHNTYNSNDVVIMGVTPKVLQDIGFSALPIAMTKNHIYSVAVSKQRAIAEKRYKSKYNYHDLGFSTVKDIYKKLSNPLMVLAHPDFVNKRKRDSTHKVVAFVDFAVNGKQVIAPIEIDTDMNYHNVHIDVNLVSTYFDKNNITDYIKEAIALETNHKTGFYYLDKKRTQSVFKRAGIQSPRQLDNLSSNIIIRKIDGNVNRKISDITQSQQFIRWFGDWQNDTENASKVVDKDGKPLVVYHQTGADFTVFDTESKGAGRYDDETPNGIFLKPTNSDIGLQGQKQMALYASIKNPLIVRNREELVRFYQQNINGYSEMKDALKAIDFEYSVKYDTAAQKADEEYAVMHRKLRNKEITREEYDRFAKKEGEEERVIKEWKQAADKASEDLKAFVTDYFKKSKYDGVIIEQDTGSFGRSTKTYIAFESEQVKSATNNIGTFDRNNPDIRYSKDDTIYDSSEIEDLFDDYEDSGNDSGDDKPVDVKNLLRHMSPDEAIFRLSDRIGQRAVEAIRSPGAELTEEECHAIAQRMMKGYNIKRKGNEALEEKIAKRIAMFTENIRNSPKSDYSVHMNALYSACRKYLESSGKYERGFMQDTAQKVKAILRGRTLILPQNAATYILGDYGSLKNLNNAYGGYISVVSEADKAKAKNPIYMEALLQKLGELQPIRELFPDAKTPDDYTGWGFLDNLIGNVLKPKFVNPYYGNVYENMDDAALEMANRIAVAVVDEMAGKTAAGGKALRIIFDSRNALVSDNEALQKVKLEKYRSLKQVNNYYVSLEKTNFRKQYAERQRKNAAMRRLGRKLDSLTKRLDGKANKNEYIPETLKKPLLDVLELFKADPGQYKNGRQKSEPSYFGAFRELTKVKERINTLTAEYAKLEGETDFKDALGFDINALNFDKGILNELKELSDYVGEKNVYQLDSGELEMIAEVLDDLDNQLKRAVEIIVDGKKTTIQEQTTKGIEQTEKVYYKKDSRKFIADVLKDARNRYIATSLDPVRYGKFLSGYKEGAVWNLLMNDLHSGDQKRVRIMQQAYSAVQAVTAKYSRRELNDLQRKAVDEFTMKDLKTGEDVKLSQGMLLAVYLTNMQQDGHRHLCNDLANHYTRVADLDTLNGNRVLPDLRKKQQKAISEKSHEVRFDEATLRRINEYVESTPLLKELAGAIHGTLNGLLADEINKVSLQRSGKLIATVKNYFPLRVDQNDPNKKFTPSFEGENIFTDERMKSRGFTKQRTRSYNAIVIGDALNVFQRHVNETAEYCGLLIPVENIKKIINSDNGEITMRKEIENKFGGSAIHYLNKLLGDIQKRKDNTDENVITSMTGHAMGAALAFNPRSWLKNYGALPLANKHFGAANVMKAVAATKAGWGKTGKDLVEKYNDYTPYMWYREQGNGTIVGELSRQHGLYGKFSNAVDMMGKFDRAVVNLLLYASEQNVKQTTELDVNSEEFKQEVAKRFEKCIDESQPNSMLTSKPQFVRNDVMRVLSLNAFASQRMAMGNSLMDSFMEFRARSYENKMEGTAETKAAARKALKGFVSTFFGVLLSAGLQSLLGVLASILIFHKWDDLKDDEGNVTMLSALLGGGKMFIKGFPEEFFGSFAWMDRAYSFVEKRIDGNAYGSDFNVMSFSAVEDIVKNIEGGNWAKAYGRFADLLGLSAFGGSNMQKLGQSGCSYINDLFNGRLGFTANNGKPDYSFMDAWILAAYDSGNKKKGDELTRMWIEQKMSEGKSREQAQNAVDDKLIEGAAQREEVMQAAIAEANGNYPEAAQIKQELVDMGLSEYVAGKAVDKVIPEIKKQMKAENITDFEEAEGELTALGFNENAAEKLAADYIKSLDTTKSEPAEYTETDAFNALKNGELESYEIVKAYLVENGSKSGEEVDKDMRSLNKTKPLFKELEDATDNGPRERLDRINQTLLNIYGDKAAVSEAYERYKKNKNK